MEESVNFVKVNTSSDEDDVIYHSPPSPKRRRTIAVIVTLTLLALIIIVSILAAGVFNVNPNGTKPPSSNSVKSLNSIKAVCAVTQNPDTCITDITAIDSGNNSVDPELIFNLTLQLAVTELTNVSSLPKTLISKSSDLQTGPALRDCATLFDDALSQLSKSAELMRVDSRAETKKKVLLTESKIADMKTWISAAMTDQETCVDGLEETGSTAVDEVKHSIKKSSYYMSNSLAILVNMENILEKFGLRLH